MLEVFVSFISCLIPAIITFYIINRLIEQPLQRKKFQHIMLVLLISTISTIIQYSQPEGIHTFIIFCCNVMIYKVIFKININESIIATIISMLMIFTSDLFISLILMKLLALDIIRNNPIWMMIINLLIMILSITIFNIKIVKRTLKNFFLNTKKAWKISENVFLILVLIIVCIVVYNINENNTIDYMLNISTIIIIGTLTIIYINNKNTYSKLSAEYDALFTYVQTFEDWIEKEQLNRHEYKNQLAVLRCLTKEKKVKDKIDEILEDNINIEGQAVTQLKYLPKGGIKGLMYYKAAIAQKQKIKLTADVSIESKGILTKLTEKEIRVLCKLVGIYFDNAIEAATESRKKIVSIEIYELKDKVSIVFSNTFKRHRNINDRNKKGVSSKGQGRGNGLYFAEKLIKENSWLDQKQEIIDNYYIQQIMISKNKTH